MARAAAVGIDLDVEAVHADPTTALFSESASRVVVAVDADKENAVLERAGELGIPAAVIGTTNDSAELNFAGVSVGIAELADAWAGTLPQLFGQHVGANSTV